MIIIIDFEEKSKIFLYYQKGFPHLTKKTEFCEAKFGFFTLKYLVFTNSNILLFAHLSGVAAFEPFSLDLQCHIVVIVIRLGECILSLRLSADK